jgi:hypothetical protein
MWCGDLRATLRRRGARASGSRGWVTASTPSRPRSLKLPGARVSPASAYTPTSACRRVTAVVSNDCAATSRVPRSRPSACRNFPTAGRSTL